MVKSEFKKNGIISANSLLKNKLKYYNDEMLRWIKNYSIVDENGDICFAKLPKIYPHHQDRMI